MARKTVAHLESVVASLEGQLGDAKARMREAERRASEAEAELKAQRDITRIAEREADRLRGWMDRVREEQSPREIKLSSQDIAGKDDYSIGAMIRTMLARGGPDAFYIER